MCLLKRKTGMSMAEFIDYYENKHVPLIRRLLPFQSDYRRNYVHPDTAISTMDGQASDYDVVTEAWFATAQDYEQFCADSVKPEIREALVGDEMNFIDRYQLKFFVVDERNSMIG
jgi:uncharacterized protein (TIGR02118 family)